MFRLSFHLLICLGVVVSVGFRVMGDVKNVSFEIINSISPTKGYC